MIDSGASADAAWLHEILHTGNPGDAAFYARACKGAASVLELGSGTGRVLVRLARGAGRVTGLEIDPGMLERARQRLARERVANAALVLGDMTTFALGERFERIAIPYNGLLCLLDDASVASCLRACFEHLAPGGSLFFDVYQPPRIGPAEAEAIATARDAPRLLASLEVDGARVEVFERDIWDPPAQRVDAIYRYDIRRGKTFLRAEQTIAQRYLYREQIEAHLRAAGFAAVQIWGGFGGEKLTARSDAMIVRAQAG